MKKVVILFVDLYKLIFSKTLLFLFGSGCRFNPTCSEYSKEAIKRFGIPQGMTLSIKRIVKCHPLAKSFYFDPVPKKV